MPSYYRDPGAPAPNRPRRVGVVAFVERDGSLLLELGAAHVPLIEAFLEGPARPVVA